MDARKIFMEEYDYVLPQEKIAQFPVAERDHARLLIYKDSRMSEDQFFNLPDHLPAQSLLVFNDTRVIHARLFFKNEHDAIIEIFLLEPASPHEDMQLALMRKGTCVWRCLIGNAKKWREEKLVRKFTAEGESGSLEVKIIGKQEQDFLVDFFWRPESLAFAEVIAACGYVPLPPYIKRRSNADDAQRYQTIYASHNGSVAAPTAGLHFTTNVLERLKGKSIHSEFITLHVGAGTFKPVKSETIADHTMHQEQMIIKKETVQNIIKSFDQMIIAVGTTSLRALESMYWIGKKILLNQDHSMVHQWDPYSDEEHSIPATESLGALVNFMEQNEADHFIAETQLLIVPGYRFRMAKALITNFHIPKSTLLLLIAAFIGEDWKRVYDYALKNDFRFLSYGDSSLLWRK
jgi:S-adenosylmethionine:tRNA ribosyltransferase-isomerase